MKALEKIVWAEGVVLTQQHFQRWDSVQAATHTAWHGMLTAFPWGVDTVAWSTAGMGNRLLELTELKAVFPDGRLIHFRQKDATTVQLVIDDEAIGEQLVIYAAIPDVDSIAGITGYEQPQGDVAWQADYCEVADAYDDTRKEEILFARPQLVLLTENELRQGLVVLPVACIRRQGDGRYDLDETWQPGLIHLKKHTHSHELLKKVQQQLVHRVSQYQEKRRHLGDLSSFSSVELAGFMLQKDLATHLVELTGLLEQSGSHPYAAFMLLSRLIAQLRLYTGSGGGVDYEYRHHDQINCLHHQTSEVERLLGELTYEQDVQLRLNRNDQGILVTDEHNIEDFSRSDFYLAITLPGLNQDALDTFPDFCKVAASSGINQLIESALPGLTLRYCKRIPAKIRQKSGCEYFAIEKDGMLWQQAEQDQSLAIFCSGEFIDAEIELLAVNAS